jgi:glycosyltransferase involved in cell wall biosynthesis
VVATEVGGLSSLITNGENGFLVPSEDAHAMAEKISEILGSSSLTAKFSRLGRRTAEDCSWSAVKPKWEKLLADVVGASAVDTVERQSLRMVELNGAGSHGPPTQ